jgi:hypothetical protein
MTQMSDVAHRSLVLNHFINYLWKINSTLERSGLLKTNIRVKYIWQRTTPHPPTSPQKKAMQVFNASLGTLGLEKVSLFKKATKELIIQSAS